MSRQTGAPPGGWPWAGLWLVILFVIVVRVRLLNVPLERDEGEFAYVGQLMLEGVVPYKLAYVVKLPGVAAVYALGMALFGQTTAAIHLGLLLANVTAIVLVFLLAKRWFGHGVALAAGAVYAVMSLSWGVDGYAAHATQFIVPAAIAGILLLQRGLASARLATLFWSGILFGFAFLLKQPGILFGAFGGFLLWNDESRTGFRPWAACLKKAAVFCLGIILPFAALCLVLWRAGVFGRFWFWSFTVAGGGWVSWQEGWNLFILHVHWLWTSRQWPFWCLAGLALPFVCRRRAARGLPILPFLVFCGVSIFAGCVGLRFIPHYFVLTLPAVGMAIGLGVAEARQFLQDSPAPACAAFLPATLLVLLCGYVVIADRHFLFRATPDELAVMIYGRNPFREAAAVADYIRKNSNPDSRIAVLGSEPEIYFYAHRRSATGHVSTYILTEGRSYSHDMQEEMVREIKAARPEYIVLINSTLSWSVQAPFADHTALDEVGRLVKESYKPVGLAAAGAAGAEPVYYWGAQAAARLADTPARILVYRMQNPS